jgi:MFS family permease
MAILGIVLYILIGKRTRAEIKRRQEQPEKVPEPTGVEKVQWGRIIPFLVISVITGTVVQSVTSYVSLYATDVLMVPEPKAVALMSITPAVGLFAAPLGGYLSDRFGGMKVIITVAFLSIPIMYLMGNAPNVPVLIVLMIAMGLIMNTRMPTSESYLTSNVPVNRRATIMGVYYFSGTGITAPLAPAIGELLKNKGFPWTFGLASAVTAVITVACAGFIWKNRGYNRYPEITGEQ